MWHFSLLSPNLSHNDYYLHHPLLISFKKTSSKSPPRMWSFIFDQYKWALLMHMEHVNFTTNLIVFLGQGILVIYKVEAFWARFFYLCLILVFFNPWKSHLHMWNHGIWFMNQSWKNDFYWFPRRNCPQFLTIILVFGDCAMTFASIVCIFDCTSISFLKYGP